MFQPSDRSIYRFQDRTGNVRSADPLAVWDAFIEAIGDETPGELFEAERAAMKPADWPENQPFLPDKLIIRESRDARRRIVAALKTAFGIKTIDEDPEAGFLQNDLFTLWNDMFGFMESLKKSTGVSQSSPQPTGEPPP